MRTFSATLQIGGETDRQGKERLQVRVMWSTCVCVGVGGVFFFLSALNDEGQSVYVWKGGRRRGRVSAGCCKV